MANDFKRMWTQEELKSNSVLDLPDIPEVVDANSPDIIRVQGKLYYKEIKEGGSGLTNTTWVFNENYNVESFNTLIFNIDFNSNNTRYRLIKFSWSGGLDIYYGTSYVHTPWGGWENKAYRTITITGGQDVENQELINFLVTNALLVDSKTHYSYKELGADEELVKSIPTDVNIVNDQGEWQLQLEHDSNVLSITSMGEFMNSVSSIENIYINVDDVNPPTFTDIITAFQNGVTPPSDRYIDVRYNFVTQHYGIIPIILKSFGVVSLEDEFNYTRWYLQYVDLETNELKQIIFGLEYNPSIGNVKLKLKNTYTIGTLSQ